MNDIQKMNYYKALFNTASVPNLKWKIFRNCNYCCSYCKSKKPKTKELFRFNPAILARIVSKFVKPNWRISLTGGELTIDMKSLHAIVRTISRYGHEMRIMSNFSASIEDYISIEKESKHHVRSFFMTYHPSYISRNLLVSKALKLRRMLNKKCKIHVRQVILPQKQSVDNFWAIKTIFDQYGIEIIPMRLQIKKDNIHTISNYSRYAIIKSIFRNSENFYYRYGTYCPAGYQYAYIDPELNVYTCVPARTDTGCFMGNLLEKEVTLNSGPRLCTSKLCYCVPGR